MSKELAKTYDPKGIEERLYQKWMENGYFHAKVNPDKKPFTIVMPPPNVTGQLHMGPRKLLSRWCVQWEDIIYTLPIMPSTGIWTYRN